MRTLHFIFVFLATLSIANAQTFTKITDLSNPIISDPGIGDYAGASWVDFDNDGYSDLFISRTGNMYRNTGNGQFQKWVNLLPAQGLVRGNTWADVDNDGDLDAYVVGGANEGSYLYINNGGGSFTKVVTGMIGNGLDNPGWAAAWGDYDNDGFVDLIIASPFNFAGIHTPNILIHNDGNLNFSRVDSSSIVTNGVDTYTVPSWSDYDNDGDLDLFIGAGPVNASGKDYLYKNYLKESTVPFFERIISTPMTNDLQDGQHWNLVDFDNDGDLDAFITNYSGGNTGFVNRLYRNDNGFYTMLTAAQAGPIVSDLNASLASVWADFDNDGDLDCFVTNDAGQQNAYYQNNWSSGSGVFTRINTHPFTQLSGEHQGASVADYDRDGDLDLFVSGLGQAKGLYRNDTQNGNHWVNLLLEGVTSNRSGVGAKVRAKAMINGNPVWQMREVSTQNTFNGMNSLNIEFGFADATVIDSLIIEWPSGIKDIHVAIPVDQYYDAIENSSLIVGISLQSSLPLNDQINVYPNPINSMSVISWTKIADPNSVIEIIDMSGRIVYNRSMKKIEMDQMKISWKQLNLEAELSPGLYLISLKGNSSVLKTKILIADEQFN